MFWISYVLHAHVYSGYVYIYKTIRYIYCIPCHQHSVSSWTIIPTTEKGDWVFQDGDTNVILELENFKGISYRKNRSQPNPDDTGVIIWHQPKQCTFLKEIPLKITIDLQCSIQSLQNLIT